VNELEESAGLITLARQEFHRVISSALLTRDAAGVPSNADRASRASVAIASRVADEVGSSTVSTRLAGQVSGSSFEEVCETFLQATFLKLGHLRPGRFEILRRNRNIANYEQYSHLAELKAAADADPELAAALGRDYIIAPDRIIVRYPEEDDVLNAGLTVVDSTTAQRASLRKSSGSRPLLHASVSSKWTLRSDRAQNARTEALNLLRNRKGPLPHIVVVTGEPLPSRIASLALGTGDIDCVYHFALPELLIAVNALDYQDSLELIQTMIDGKRLKDISDLPLDLAI
jgi:hypothetical protein